MLDYPKFRLANESDTCLRADNVFVGARGKLHLGTPEEARVLHELAGGLHDDIDGYVIELGTYAGATAAIMAHAVEYYSRQLPIIAIDRYHWNPTVLSFAQDMFQRIGQANNIVQIVFDDLRAFKLFCNLPIRLLFIDSNHVYDHVMNTLEICVPSVQSGGWIVLHDYDWRSKKSRKDRPGQEYTDVVYAFQDFLSTDDNQFESIFLADSLLCLKKR